jgi:hypothetical protein
VALKSPGISAGAMQRLLISHSQRGRRIGLTNIGCKPKKSFDFL